MTASPVERIVELLPGFEPERHARSLKCVVWFGWFAGARVCVKMLNHAEPLARHRRIAGPLPELVLRSCLELAERIEALARRAPQARRGELARELADVILV